MGQFKRGDVVDIVEGSYDGDQGVIIGPGHEHNENRIKLRSGRDKGDVILSRDDHLRFVEVDEDEARQDSY